MFCKTQSIGQSLAQRVRARATLELRVTNATCVVDIGMAATFATCRRMRPETHCCYQRCLCLLPPPLPPPPPSRDFFLPPPPLSWGLFLCFRLAPAASCRHDYRVTISTRGDYDHTSASRAAAESTVFPSKFWSFSSLIAILCASCTRCSRMCYCFGVLLRAISWGPAAA